MCAREHITLIETILSHFLNPREQRAFIFGSRATGTASKFSDIDIGIEGKRPPASVMFDILESFEGSKLPYVVEIVHMDDVSEKFKRVATSKIIPLHLRSSDG